MKRILNQYKLSVNCSTDNLELIRSYVNQIAKKAQVTDTHIQQIEMAVDEACTNVIKHACNYDENKSMTVIIKLKEGEFIVEVIDRGNKSFDPESVREVNLKEFVKNRQHGGLGIHLIKNLMDDVSFFIGNNNQNRVKMLKRI